MAGSTKKQPQSSAKPRSIPIVGIVVAVVAVLAVVAVVFAGNTEVGSEYGEPQVQGQLSLMPPETAVDTSATGETAPIVIGADFDGNEVRIENDGRAKAIVLLAHWCPHCQAEVPRVTEWLNASGGPDNVDFYSVSTSMNSAQPNFPPSEWLARENWQIPVIRDDQEGSVWSAYGAGGFPFWVFTNSDGTVAMRTSGQLQIEQLELILDSLN